MQHDDNDGAVVIEDSDGEDAGGAALAAAVSPGRARALRTEGGEDDQVQRLRNELEHERRARAREAAEAVEARVQLAAARAQLVERAAPKASGLGVGTEAPTALLSGASEGVSPAPGASPPGVEIGGGVAAAAEAAAAATATAAAAAAAAADAGAGAAGPAPKRARVQPAPAPAPSLASPLLSALEALLPMPGDHSPSTGDRASALMASFHACCASAHTPVLGGVPLVLAAASADAALPLLAHLLSSAARESPAALEQALQAASARGCDQSRYSGNVGAVAHGTPRPPCQPPTLGPGCLALHFAARHDALACARLLL